MRFGMNAVASSRMIDCTCKFFCNGLGFGFSSWTGLYSVGEHKYL